MAIGVPDHIGRPSYQQVSASKLSGAAPVVKKLSGAAKTSFEKKCIADAGDGEMAAKATCEAASKEKKLSGAAKTSFEQKCVKDAMGEVKPAG